MKKISSIFLICLVVALPIFLNACATALDMAGWVYSVAPVASALTPDNKTPVPATNPADKNQEMRERENPEEPKDTENIKLNIPKLQLQQTSF